MPRITEPSEQLLDLIYDAATDPHLWPSIFREIAGLTHSINGVLLGQSRTEQTIFFQHHYDTSEESLRALKERHVLNPWTIYMESENPVGVVVPSDRIVPLADLRRTGFFDEVLRPQGVGHSAMIGLAKKPDFGVGFSLNRGPRQGPYGEEELHFLERLVPHMQRSIRLGLRIEAYKVLQRNEYQALDQLVHGVVLLDRNAKVLFANAAARALERAAGLRLRNGRIGHTVAAYARRLEWLVQSVLQGVPMGAVGVPRGEDGLSLTVLASSVRGKDVDRFAEAHLGGAAVMLFLIDPMASAGVPDALLRDAFGLTQAEARVALAVSAGFSIPETASRLRLSSNTVKTHLGKVFAKTGSRRQADLARLIASLGVLKANGKALPGRR